MIAKELDDREGALDKRQMAIATLESSRTEIEEEVASLRKSKVEVSGELAQLRAQRN